MISLCSLYKYRGCYFSFFICGNQYSDPKMHVKCKGPKIFIDILKKYNKVGRHYNIFQNVLKN